MTNGYAVGTWRTGESAGAAEPREPSPGDPSLWRKRLRHDIIQDYVSGTAHDPFLKVAARPAKELTTTERRFALQYLFQANPVHMIGRYPRYQALWERFRGAGDSPERADKYFQAQDFTDLQVLSQIAWFDEFFLEDPEIAALIKKGQGLLAGIRGIRHRR